MYKYPSWRHRFDKSWDGKSSGKSSASLFNGPEVLSAIATQFNGPEVFSAIASLFNGPEVLSAIASLFNGPEVLSSASHKAKLFVETTFLRTLILMT